MKITTYIENENYSLILEGELDASSAIALDQAIEKAILKTPKTLWIDCNKLDYISSAGIGVFISQVENLEEKNIIIKLCNVSTQIRCVFNMLGIDTIISIVACPKLQYFL